MLANHAMFSAGPTIITTKGGGGQAWKRAGAPRPWHWTAAAQRRSEGGSSELRMARSAGSRPARCRQQLCMCATHLR